MFFLPVDDGGRHVKHVFIFSNRSKAVDGIIVILFITLIIGDTYSMPMDYTRSAQTLTNDVH